MSRLRISKCAICNAVSWPIQEYCSRCFAQTHVTDAAARGTIRAFSKKDKEYFCVAEFDGISLICTLCSKDNPRVGQEVVFLRHYNDGSDHFEVAVADDITDASLDCT